MWANSFDFRFNGADRRRRDRTCVVLRGRGYMLCPKIIRLPTGRQVHAHQSDKSQFEWGGLLSITEYAGLTTINDKKKTQQKMRTFPLFAPGAFTFQAFNLQQSEETAALFSSHDQSLAPGGRTLYRNTHKAA